MTHFSNGKSINPLDVGHAIVFDCNIYLRAASAVGEPFEYSTLESISKGELQVDSDNKDVISCLTYSATGMFAKTSPLVVCTSDHISQTVEFKAIQGRHNRLPEDRGLGFTQQTARSLVNELISPLVSNSGGKTYSKLPHSAEDIPPLDHEDSSVYELCKRVKSDFALAKVWCVTLDKDFYRSSSTLSNADYIAVVPPRMFLSAWKAQMNEFARSRMRKSK